MDGDWEDALEEVARTITGTLLDLSVKNPAKNVALGTDLPTMADVGGLQGIWAHLTGRGNEAEIALPDPMTDVAAMEVQAASRPWQVTEEDTTDARGQRQKKYVMSELTSEGLATRGGSAAKTLATDFGMRRATRGRPI